MLAFRKLELSDIEQIKPFFLRSKNRTCDDTIGGTFMWRVFFETEYVILNDTLIFKARYFHHTTAFCMPIGQDVSGALDEIKNYCDNQKIPMVICTATKRDIAVLENDYHCSSTPATDWFDYLYQKDDLFHLTGRKYSGQRNHINYFKKTFGNYHLEAMSSANLQDAIKLLNDYRLSNQDTSPIFLEEQARVFEVLENYDIYDLVGTIIYVDETPVAFAMGEIIGDTLYVHIEKANTNYRGAYQMIVNEFVRMHSNDQVLYVNREEDVGDEGLRTSKLSYHPTELIEKYTVIIHESKKN
jgi:hypothetical protein